jgi:glucokinase
LYYGTGKGKKNIIMLTLGTGVGGAIIIDGKLYRGNGFAGEPGHIQINGKSLESQASGTAATLLGKKYKLNCLNAIDVEACALQGNKKAIKIYKDIGKTLGQAILNISYLIDPEVFILGGGFARAPFILEEIHKITKHQDILKRNLKIVKAKTGVEAGLIGAALLSSLR